jgi:iron complex transport system substrate-binding protein
MKIVSLLAAATEILCELGLEDELVGISHECDHPPEALDRPRISKPAFDLSGKSGGAIDQAIREGASSRNDLYEIDVDQLRELSPHLILAQAVCEVCAVPTEDARNAVRAAEIEAEVLSLDAHSIRDVLESVTLIGEATGAAGRAETVIANLRRRSHEVTRAVAGAPRPRVLALEWLDPLFVPGHWVPEMIDLAGGECVAGEAKGRSVETTEEELAESDPDVLLIMPCGYGLAATRRDAAEHAELLARLAPRAIDGGRAFVVDGSAYFNRSGPRIVDGIEILGGLLHPELLALPMAGAADTWKPDATSDSLEPTEIAAGI